MIRITKPQQAPAVLLSRGKTKRTSLCSLYSRYPHDYDSGQRKFSFDSAVYGDASVKQALVEAQQGKCAFCESKIGYDGDVEHFRPKAGCSQGEGEPLMRPGYYWLAYEWDNLLFACPICNQRFKRNYFPLVDPSARARSHKDDLSQEAPIFINPSEQNPEEYIAFRKEIPYAVNGNAFGVATIAALGLGREILNERRRDRLSHLTVIRESILVLDHKPQTPEVRQLISKAKALLAQAVSDNAEYAAMVRCAAAANFYI